MSYSIRTLSILVMLLVLSGLPANAQTQTPIQQSDELTKAFISELRLLRIAIENLTNANSRVQVLSMRASQQEQRLSSISGQLTTLKMKLAEINAEVALTASQLEDGQERLRIESDPKIRRQLEEQQQTMKIQFTAVRLKQSALQSEVDQLTQQAMAEQSRLSEIQQRLDEVERLLGLRRDR